ncbi:peptidylprolyl isomerase [Pontivivens insulae]|uniref:Peptidyl-prolyl cis-trans isomerase D n=1 Tax=Pontivivens insulae TaxID=1639689 RepID=A0A2R8AAQ9_9RHOB|nr:peptidylprolyl isomerase [Pontivivens insulae]RED13230.1 peptidyl-prolyl cis-trans isomerase D [Pontivivens insulae]SPF29322.1 Peptidyl-prolyl cis-trans isomerase D [Pontivivens insulae]
MLSSMRSKKSGIFGWIIIILLIIGLGAFGFTDLLQGGSSNRVARVGDAEVTAQEYSVALQNRLGTIQQQFGVRLDPLLVQSQGVDRQITSELLRTAALEDEASRLGLSMPDNVVAREIASTPGLRNADGEVDIAAYEFFLGQRGLTPASYEALMRDQITVGTLSAALTSGAQLPPTYAHTTMRYLGEERSIDWVIVPADPLALDDPGDAVLEQHLEAFAERFETDEQRVVTYATLSPAMIADTLDYEDDFLRGLFEDNIEDYQTPERRILDRLSFGTPELAEEAKARIDAGEITLVGLAEERGLSQNDISLGLTEQSELPSSARDAVFALDGPGTVGPFDTDLGPAIYTVNAILPALSQGFEDVREELRAAEALAEAQQLVLDEATNAEILIAGGAQPEDIAAETSYELETATLTLSDRPAVLANEAFASELGEDRDQVETDALEFFHVRVDEIIPPALPALADIRDEVLQDWRDSEALTIARTQADALIAEIEEGITLSALAERDGLVLQSDDGITRDGTAGLLPEESRDALFELEIGSPIKADDEAGAVIAVLTAITEFDVDSDEGRDLQTILDAQVGADYQQDLVGYFSNAIAEEQGFTVNQQLIDYIVQNTR